MKKIFFPEICRKTSFLAFSRDFGISCFWFFAQRCVLTMLKTWHESDLWEKFFAVENSGNMPEIAVFADFVSNFIISFFWFFCTKMRNSIAQNMAESDFGEIFFSCRKCRKSPFLQIFFGFLPYISLFFQTKTFLITLSTIKSINCQKNWFLKPELSKKIFEKLLINYFLLFFSNFDDHFVYFFQSQYVSYWTYHGGPIN